MRNTCTVEGCDKFCVGGGLCRKHYMRKVRNGTTDTFRDDPIKLFWRKVEKTETCWNWLGASTNGYGTVAISQRPTRSVGAHRYAYEMLQGPIPKGMTIDHLCLNRGCVNPDHMEVVTRGENARRGNPKLEYCKRGHPRSGDNLYYPPKGGPPHCRACKAMTSKLWVKSHH